MKTDKVIYNKAPQHPKPNFEKDLEALALQAHFRSSALAALIHRSERQLRNIARRHFGCSLRFWLDEQRLRLAVELLREQNSVKSVSASLGFRQVSHFSRKFKLRYKLPPSNFLLR